MKKFFTGLFMLLSTAAYGQSQQTLNAYVTGLPAVTTPLTGTELFYTVQGGISKHVSASTLGGVSWSGGQGLSGDTICSAGATVVQDCFHAVFYVDAPPYSAAGNGTTNDQGAIAAALTACSNAGGGTVVLGPHRYLIDTIGLTIPVRCGVLCPAPLQGTPANTNINYSVTPYAVVLNSAISITMSSQSKWQGCSVLSKSATAASLWVDYPSMTLRDLLTIGTSFSGTAFTWNARDVIIRDTLIAGFATGVSTVTDSSRARFDHVNMDDTRCLTITNSHDISRYSHVECWPFLTAGFANTSATLAIAGVANNGSGAYRVTLSSASAIPVTGDTVWIDTTMSGVQSIQAQHWTITQIDTTHIDLQGSAGTGSVTPTGNATNGSQVLTNLSSTANIGVGEGITGTGIPAATTVTWVSVNGNDIGISAAATATNAGITFTLTDTAYSSGGNVKYDSGFRNDTGMDFTASEGIENNDLFVNDHTTGFHLGTGMNWFQCVNCWVDSGNADLTFVGVLSDSTSKGTTWTGGRLNGLAIRLNSSNGNDGNVFTGVVLDSGVLTPTVEVDQGIATFTGNVATSGGYFLFKDAMTNVNAVGNNWTGKIQFETSTGPNNFAGIGNNFAANSWRGFLNLGAYQVTLGGGATACGTNNNGNSCITSIGGQFVDSSFSQSNMVNNGTDTPSGNTHSRYYHATGTVGAWTINMPGIGSGGQEFNMYFDQAVTTLTMGGTTSQGMPAAAVANTWYKCMANPAKTTWLCSAG